MKKNHLPKFFRMSGFILLAMITFASSQMDASARQPVQTTSATYYVRADGGSETQCTGLVDAAYPGSGTGQDCAWDHPFRALPPGGTPRIAGGDTLIVAEGAYKMGFGAPGAENCDAGGSFDCLMPPIPSGPDAGTPTRILGAGWDSGCSNPPELWGAERPWFIVNLTDSSNVEFSCFEITDHSSCVEDHSGGLACQRDTSPYGDWASYGLYAEDSTNVLLRDLDIHGLAWGGIHAGRLTDWTVENVRIAGNGGVGWDGNLWDGSGSSNSGALTFRHWLVEWNGCGETYPTGQPIGCWAQTAGGYGDGVGTEETGGDWLIEDSQFLHNTSDGLDLLYHSLGGNITLNRVRAEGNAGNQIKVTGQAQVSNSVLVGNCAFFDNKPFTYNVDPCRALGNTLSLNFMGGESVSILNSTIYGQGDGLIEGGPRGTCSGAETITARNNVFLGDSDYFDPGDATFLFYQEGCSGLNLNSDYNIIYNAKNVTCNASETYAVSGVNDLCQNPLLTGPLSGTTYGMRLSSGSPAIGSGDDAVCSTAPVSGVDQIGGSRSSCDRGALEYASPSHPPTDISLSNNVINEHRPAMTLVGLLSAVDSVADDIQTYSFCGGAGDSTFVIVEGALDTAAVLDYETKGAYNICIRATDSQGGTYDKPFTITVADVSEETAKNGGFESYLPSASKIPRYWVASRFGSGDGKNTTKKYGKFSVKINGAGVGKTLTQTLSARGPAGDLLTFSYWAKGSSIPKTGKCLGQVMLYNGATRLMTKSLNCPTGKFGFRQLKTTFTATGAYNKVIIKFTYSKTSGAVWFDAVSLVR